MICYVSCNQVRDRMGLDLSMKGVGGDFNITYNVSPIWYKIFPDDTGMISIEGMTGKEAKKKLTFAHYKLTEYARELTKLEPANGWGSFNILLNFVEKLIEQCNSYPNNKWIADR